MHSAADPGASWSLPPAPPADVAPPNGQHAAVSEHEELLRQAHAEAEAIKGELPLLQVSLNYELSKARELSASAERRLAEAHDEAQSLVKDAAHQASLVAEAAERSAEQIVAQARAEADEHRAGAHAHATEIRGQAEQVVAREHQTAAEVRDQVAAELAQLRAEHERGHMDRETSFSNDLANKAAAAELLREKTQADAAAAAAELRRAAQQELDQAGADAEKVRAEARDEINHLLQRARAEAAEHMAAAAEQTAWTQRTVAGLIEAAELDAKGIRQRAHADAAELTADVRGRLAAVLNASRQTMEKRRTAAALVESEAQFHLEDAKHDALEIREQAAEQARKMITAGDDEGRLRRERAERRLVEAESGARSLREHAAQEMERSHREGHELRRATRAEATRMMEQARAEADEVRTTARQLLADARAEVATLTQQRDQIAKELAALSGVIDALAVPDNPSPPAPALAVAPTPVPPAPEPPSAAPGPAAPPPPAMAAAPTAYDPPPRSADPVVAPLPPNPPENYDTEKMRAP